MFMVKDEWTNIKNLLRVRIETHAKAYKWLLIFAVFFYLIPSIGTVSGIIRSDFVRFYTVSDFSVLFLFGMAIGFFIQMFMYRSTNDKLSVYPQTNNSRFISSLLYNFLQNFAMALSLLAMYLIQFGSIKLLSVFMPHVHLALDFNLIFLAVGLFVFVIYCSLIFATIELIGAILRKWTYYAIIFFTAVLSLVITNILEVIERAPNALAFLIQEPSLIVFFLKAIFLLLAILGTAIVINHYTVYHKSRGYSLGKNAVIGGIAITTAVLFVGLSLVRFNMAVANENTIVREVIINEYDAIPWEEFLQDFEEIRIDISHLPNGSSIEAEVKSREVLIEIVTGARFFNDRSMSIIGLDSLQNIQGDTLVISYRPPLFYVDRFMLTDFADSQLTANLDGNVLHLDYTFDNVQVVILPIWGMARQFELFHNRNAFREAAVGFFGGGSMVAEIHIHVE